MTDPIQRAYLLLVEETTHPHRDDIGRQVRIWEPHQSTDIASWQDPTKHATITPGHDVLDADSRFKDSTPNWNDPALHGDFKEPEVNNPSRKPIAAGAIIHEDDGRIWVVHPTNQFGGYSATFPKGRVEHNMSPRASAIKEAWEESGLHIQLTGHAIDTERSTTFTRYYHAKRIGGHPKNMGWESQAVSLVPKNMIAKVVDHPNDAKIIKSLA